MQFQEERSVGSLISDLMQDVRSLMQQEFRLARIEMSEKVSEVGKAVTYLAIGGAIAYAGFLVILAAIVIALAAVMPWWLSALLVGVIVTVAGYLFVQRGRTMLKETSLTPHETIETLQRTKDWAQEEVRGNGNGSHH